MVFTKRSPVTKAADRFDAVSKGYIGWEEGSDLVFHEFRFREGGRKLISRSLNTALNPSNSPPKTV